MKVLLLNGSPNEHGCTYTALCEVARALEESGVETETLWIGNRAVRGCIGCGGCAKNGRRRCVFEDDLVNAALDRMQACDGLVVGSPVHYAAAGGSITSWLSCSASTASSVSGRRPRLRRCISASFTAIWRSQPQNGDSARNSPSRS